MQRAFLAKNPVWLQTDQIKSNQISRIINALNILSFNKSKNYQKYISKWSDIKDGNQRYQVERR